jgi:hypothetical protein
MVMVMVFLCLGGEGWLPSYVTNSAPDLMTVQLPNDCDHFSGMVDVC